MKILAIILFPCLLMSQTFKGSSSAKGIMQIGKSAPLGTATYIQGCVNSAAAASTSCATGSNITSGNLLVIHSKTGAVSGATTVFSISSGTGTCGTVSYALNATTVNSGYQVAVGVCIISGTGSATIQAVWTGGTAAFTDISVGEYKAASSWNATPIDQHQDSENASGSTCFTGTTATTTNANDLLVAFADVFDFAQTWGALSGWTSEPNSERNTVGWYDQYVTSTNGYSAVIPLSAADNCTGVIVALKD